MVETREQSIILIGNRMHRKRFFLSKENADKYLWCQNERKPWSIKESDNGVGRKCSATSQAYHLPTMKGERHFHGKCQSSRSFMM